MRSKKRSPFGELSAIFSRRWLLIAILPLGLLLFFGELSLSSENPSVSLTLIYSNNINAEIDPCPV
jgi:hypothetical protein